MKPLHSPNWRDLRVAIAIIINLVLFLYPGVRAGVAKRITEDEVTGSLIEGTLAAIALVILVPAFRGNPVHLRIGICVLTILPLVVLRAIISRYG